jgi:hypothetical protein
LDTVKTYKGEGRMSEDFGGVPDQAAYQAAICLIAEGRKQDGEAELVKFMRDWPMSPLVTAASRRIGRLHGGLTPREDDALLQRDLNLQQKKIQFETSVCGLKCVQAVLPMLGKAKPGLEEVAGKCGLSNKGVNCAGRRKGLLAYGVASYAYDLSAGDFAHIDGPAILIRPNHFVLLEKIEGGHACVFDPKDGSHSQEELPTDPNTPIPAILFAPLPS